MQTLSLRTFLASYSFTSSFPLSYLVPSQSARFFSLQLSFLQGSLVLMVIYPVVNSFSILSSLHSFPFHPFLVLINLTTWFLRGSLVLLVIYQVASSFSFLSFTSLFSFPFFSFLSSWLLLTDSLDGGLKSWNLQLHRLSSPVRIHYAPFKLYWNPSAALSLCTMSPKDVSASIFTIRILCLSLTPLRT